MNENTHRWHFVKDVGKIDKVYRVVFEESRHVLTIGLVETDVGQIPNFLLFPTEPNVAGSQVDSRHLGIRKETAQNKSRSTGACANVKDSDGASGRRDVHIQFPQPLLQLGLVKEGELCVAQITDPHLGISYYCFTLF